MENRSNALMVGTVTLVLVAALAAFTIWLANSGGRNRTEYDVFFKQSVDGLNRGSAVLYSGVQAGQVTEIALWRPDPQFVRVRIEVDEEVPILQGTTATLQGVGFTGVSQIQLEGAVAGAPPLPTDGPAGRPVIPTKRAGLGELLNTAPQLIERISTLTERLTELANDHNQQSLANILDNVEATSGTL
ncbi:MAG: MlaD family protein, partial [Sphingopyxis sp.]